MMDATKNPPPPALRSTLAVAGFAVAVRLAVLAAVFAATPFGMEHVAALHDGREYLLVAEALGSPAADAALPRPTQRLSPGYPILIRALSWLVPAPLAAVLLAVAGAAVATALLHRLGASPWAAALFAVLTPSWVVFSATAMSEGPFLALALAGLLAWRRNWSAGAGLAFGAATLVRPVGLVLFVALWLAGRGAPGRRPRPWHWRRGGAAALAFAVPPALWGLWSLAVQGGPSFLATYARRDGAWPLSNLLSGLAQPLADPGKALQNLFALTLVAAAAWLLWRRSRRAAGETRKPEQEPGRGHRRQWLWWLVAQAAFYVLLPSRWVFQSLPRFLVTTLPAVALAADEAAGPRRRPGAPWSLLRGLVLAFFTVASVAISIYWTLRALHNLWA